MAFRTISRGGGSGRDEAWVEGKLLKKRTEVKRINGKTLLIVAGAAVVGASPSLLMAAVACYSYAVLSI